MKNTHSYVVGQEIKVAVERKTIYANDHYSPACHESIKTLVILSQHSEPQHYSVKVKETGTVCRFSEPTPGTFGHLTGRRVRYEVLRILNERAAAKTDREVEQAVTATLRSGYRACWHYPNEVVHSVRLEFMSTSVSQIRRAIKRLEESGKVVRNGRYIRWSR